MEYSEFEERAILVHESKVENMRNEAELCAFASDHNGERILAELWGCSKRHITAMARVWSEIGPGLIYPDVPLSLYRAALDTDAPVEWLTRALDNGWSSRQLRDAADISKGKHISRVDLVKHRAEVLAWEPGRIEVSVPGWEPSGEKPAMVELRAREVLAQD